MLNLTAVFGHNEASQTPVATTTAPAPGTSADVAVVEAGGLDSSPTADRTPPDDWPGAAADFVSLLTPDDLPDRFELHQAVEVIDPAKFLRWFRQDIRRGPAGPRARWGAIQKDILTLKRIALTVEWRSGAGR